MLGPSLGLVQLLVELDGTPLGQPGRDDDEQAADQHQAAAETVKGLVGAGPKVRAEPVAGLADAVCDGDQRGLFAAGRRHQRRLPGQLQVQAVVRARDEQEQAKVAGAHVLGRDEHGAAHRAADDGHDHVPKGLLAAARGPGARAGEGVGKGVGRRLDEVGCELAKVEGFDNLLLKRSLARHVHGQSFDCRIL